MVQKRHLSEEEYDVPSKHLKLEHSCELVPFLQFTKEDAPFLSDKDADYGFDYGFLSDKFTNSPVPTTKDTDYTLPGRLSTSSITSSTTSEEDLNTDPLPQKLLIQQDTYYYLLSRPPLKNTPVGPQFQAEIPELCSQYNNNENNKFMGFCVISMPNSPTTQDQDNEIVGKGRTDCSCINSGSQNCIQQHIKEARETLKGNIGNKKFEDLGFGNTGEFVADKWSEEDEQLFHEVVYSNPASFGRNFWNHLEQVFPSKSNQEIVSYYFNVFMLRIRGEQNRCDPVNVDSDDDEWQGSDGSEETENIGKCDSDEHGNVIVDSIEGNHEFMWDIGYFSCSRTKTDFLPTGSMIEEVFGVESWDFDDSKSSN